MTEIKAKRNSSYLLGGSCVEVGIGEGSRG